MSHSMAESVRFVRAFVYLKHDDVTIAKKWGKQPVSAPIQLCGAFMPPCCSGDVREPE